VKQNEIRLYKFSEYAFRLLYHSMISIYGILLFMRHDWWLPANGGSKNFWIDYPNHTLAPDMILYCLLQGAYNVDAMISILRMSFTVQMDMSKFPFITVRWAETVRGDFNEMFIHHIITNALIFGASHFRYLRTMIAILFVHDLSDVPVDISKMAHFMRLKKTVLVFSVLLLTWIVTRLLILPLVIWKSMIYESVILEEVNAEYYFTFYPMFIGLVGGIVILHYFWFWIMMKILYSFVRTGKNQDLSEHKNGEKDDPPPVDDDTIENSKKVQ